MRNSNTTNAVVGFSCDFTCAACAVSVQEKQIQFQLRSVYFISVYLEINMERKQAHRALKEAAFLSFLCFFHSNVVIR